MYHTDVIVGVDGSASSYSALRWAAVEAFRRGASLRVLLAYHWRWPGSFAATDELRRVSHEQADALVDAAVAEARAFQPGIEITGAAVLGTPARVLLDAAEHAALVVLGCRGHNGFSAALLGSVSQQVASHAVCPVAVVRGRGERATGPVVVGVDGSTSSDQAIGLAFEEAAVRDCALVAVRAYVPPTPLWGADLPPLPHSDAEVKATLDTELAESLANWQDKFPAVPVEHLVGRGDAAQVLVGMSSGAQLIVVGSRGLGGFRGLLLGSVGLHLLHHADCPVLVSRTSDRNDWSTA